MNLEAQDKRSLSDLRMAEAQEFLGDARANRREGRHKTAVNRAYCAALSAIRFLLILEGSNPEIHEGVITMLSLRFVKPDLLLVAFVKSFKRSSPGGPMSTTGTSTPSGRRMPPTRSRAPRR